MTRVAIFDLDGTLIDSRNDLATSGNFARGRCGLPPLSVAEVLGFVGDGLDMLIERLIPDNQQRGFAKEVFSQHYQQHCCDQTQPYLGMRETLITLSETGWTLAVATNKPRLFTDAILNGCDLIHLFTIVRAGDGPKKPHPGQLLDIMAHTGASPSTTWMIGDHHTDIRAGHAAGCQVIFCKWGIGHRDGLVVNGQADHPSDLKRLLST